MRTSLAALALFLCGVPLHAQAAPDPAREAEVLAVVRAFHAALASRDSTAAIARLHPDVTIYESGHAETLADYRSGHLRSDMSFAAATERVITREAVLVRADQALYTAESHTTGRWRDRQIDSHGTETMVLVRTVNGWCIRHVHWSAR